MAFDERGRVVVDAQKTPSEFFSATGVAEHNGHLYFASVDADGLAETLLPSIT
jgi:hypothetical protein